MMLLVEFLVLIGTIAGFLGLAYTAIKALDWLDTRSARREFKGHWWRV